MRSADAVGMREDEIVELLERAQFWRESAAWLPIVKRLVSTIRDLRRQLAEADRQQGCGLCSGCRMGSTCYAHRYGTRT